MFQLLVSCLTAQLLTINIVSAAQIILINEDSQPIAGALVRVGSAEAPVVLGHTGLNGELEVADNWAAAEDVTATAEGYISTVYMGVEPADQVLVLNAMDSHAPHRMTGQTLGMDGIKKDGKVDFSIVFPALSRRQMVHFGVSSVISPGTDTINVANMDIHLPSNLTLPEQSENYIVPITFDKPDFRTYMDRAGNYRMIGLHGQFPLRQVVKDFRDGKTFFDVINHFRFHSGGQRDIFIESDMDGQTVTVGQIPFTKRISVTAPEISEDTEIMSFAIVDQAGLYFPTDLKRIVSSQTCELVVPAGSHLNYVVNLLVRKGDYKIAVVGSPQVAKVDLLLNFRELIQTLRRNLEDGHETSSDESAYSGAVSMAINGPENETPIFLDHIPKPVVTADRLTSEAPRLIASVRPVATRLVVSEVEVLPPGVYGSDKKFRVLELEHPGWTRELRLPRELLNLNLAKKYRWEILFLGQQLRQDNGDGSLDSETPTHVTRNSIDL